MVTYAQISPRMVNPRDIAGNAAEAKECGGMTKTAIPRMLSSVLESCITFYMSIL